MEFNPTVSECPRFCANPLIMGIVEEELGNPTVPDNMTPHQIFQAIQTLLIPHGIKLVPKYGHHNRVFAEKIHGRRKYAILDISPKLRVIFCGDNAGSRECAGLQECVNEVRSALH